MARRARARRGVGALTIAEQALGEPRPAGERALEAGHLEQVQPEPEA
jgi:hypothetical protein